MSFRRSNTRGTKARSRVVAMGGVVGLISTFFFAVLLVGATSASADTGVGSGGAGSAGGGGGGYNWDVFGNGKITTGKTTSNAWNSFTSGYKPCGTNCMHNFNGNGAYKWASIKSVCQHSAYIWSKDTGGYIVQAGYPQSPNGISGDLPTHATHTGGPPYSDWVGSKGATTNYLTKTVPNDHVYIYVICSSGVPLAAGQYCSDYGVTSSTYALQSGVTPSKTKASSAADALAKCALHCPTSKSSDPNGVRGSLSGNAGNAIPAKYDNSANRGSYCYSRPPNKTTQTRTQTKVTGTATTSPAYAYNWETTAVGDNGLAQNTHPGPTKFVPQTTDVESPWGKFLENLPANSCPTPAQVAAAQAKNAASPHATVALSSTNKTGLAEGGILDVSETTSYTTVNNKTTTKQPQVSKRVITTTYTFTLANTGAEYGVGNSSSKTTTSAWTGWSNTGVASSSCASSPGPSTPANTGFYQVYSNHCDAADYTARSAGSTKIATGDTTHNLSGVFVTLTKSSGDQQTLGYGQGDRAGQFNKLCSYTGVRNSVGSSSTMSTSTPTNGSVPSTAPAGPSNVTYFRDNVQHSFTVDHYVPASGGVVSYSPGTSALATIVSTWKGGTPQAPGVSNNGQFQLYANKVPLLSSAASSIPQLTGWMNFNGSPYYTGRNLGIQSGDYKTLTAAADWPSTKDKPTVFTVKWVYNPKVSTVAPVNVGFDNKSKRTYTTGTISAPIYGEVYGGQGTVTKTTPLLSAPLAANTGSATTSKVAAPANHLDGLLYFGTSLNAAGGWKVKPDAYSSYYHVIYFVRGTLN